MRAWSNSGSPGPYPGNLGVQIPGPLDMKLKLTCKTKDGRVLTGTYPYLVALARQEHALKQLNCESAILNEIEGGDNE